MQWSADNTTPTIQGKSLKLRELFAKTANAALAKGFSKEEAIFAGTNAVKIEERKNQPAKAAPAKVPAHIEALRSYTNPFEITKADEATVALTSVKSADFDADGHLVLSMSDGKKIKTKNKAVEQNIEQNIAIAPNVQILSTDTSITIDQNGQIFDIGTASVINPLDHLDFNQSTTSAGAVGRLKWNDVDGTLEFGLKGGNVTLQVGQEEVVHILNNTQSDFTDLQVIRITGASGQRMTGALALANAESTSSATFAIVTEPIAKNAIGFATVSGLVRDVNTSAFNEGDTLYLSTTVAGGITNVKPVAPNHMVLVGWCVRSNQNNGAIYVNIQNGYELNELHNVQLNGVTNGQVLTYDSALGLWKNANTSSGTGTVTSVAMTVPTGLSVTGSPITTSGTFGVSFATGYSIPTTVSQGNWNAAYSWGNHANAGYLTSFTEVDPVFNASPASKVVTYFNKISTTAGSAFTIQHNLNLADKDAFTINLMLGSETILPAVTSMDVNSITVTTSINTTNMSVMIVGIKS